MKDQDNHLTSEFFGVDNIELFASGYESILKSIQLSGVYAGDNLLTYHRNLSFLDDKDFMAAHSKHATSEIEKAILWRMNTVLWGFRNGLKLEGDFVECACYRGITARIICDTVKFQNYPNRHYYLYDLFEHNITMPHHAMDEHSKELFAEVRERFSDYTNVTVTKGSVPDILSEVAPQKIAFMHIDLNSPKAEIGALGILFDRMVPGAVLVLDDYGWLYYRDQKLAIDPWLEERGYRVLEIPTGQGIVIK